MVKQIKSINYLLLETFNNLSRMLIKLNVYFTSDKRLV